MGITIVSTEYDDDSLVMLSCSVQNRIIAGDHLIIIGEVTGLKINEGEPILYLDGDYRTIKLI